MHLCWNNTSLREQENRNVTKKWIRLAVGTTLFLLTMSTIAAAEPDFDFRTKFGTSAGAEKMTLGSSSADMARSSSSNIQLEFAMSPPVKGPISYVVDFGVFSRKHSGKIEDTVYPTNVHYKTVGLSLGAGIVLKPVENFHLEGKVEIARGKGQPDLSTPGIAWNERGDGTYSATSVILGGYYTFSAPGFQLGLELGTQSFDGKFKIWNNNGYWTDGSVKGNGATANVTLGYRF